MMYKALLVLIILLNMTLTGFSKPVKVMFSYNSDDVSLIYNDVVYKGSPKKLNIDFDLGGHLIAFKPGYESQIIKISKDNTFTTYQVNLAPLKNKFDIANVQVELKKASLINYVTNFTQEEVTEVINTKLKECKLEAYSQNSVFKDANVDLKRFSIGVEVVKSNNKNGSYSYPFYLLSHQKIKWYLLDNATNDLLLELTTEGLYLAYFKATKGMIASERLKEITVLSLEEATQKFVNSPEFNKIIMELN
jgi:hypothetical protein